MAEFVTSVRAALQKLASTIKAIAPTNGARAVGQGEIVLRVADYGADNAALADQGAAIQACLDAANTRGGAIVELTEGVTYSITTALKPKSNTKIVGRGTLKAVGSLTTYLMLVQNVSNVSLNDFTIDMNKADPTTNPNGTTNQNSNATQQGIYVSQTSATVGGSNIRINGVTVKNGWQRGIAVVASGSNVLTDIFITDCVITNCSERGIYVTAKGNADLTTPSTSRRIRILRNTISGVGNVGIQVVGCSYVWVNDNVLDGAGSTSSGIVFSTTGSTSLVTDFECSGNKIIGYITTSPATVWGIVVSVNCVRFSVADNVINGCAGGISCDVTDAANPDAVVNTNGVVSGNSVSGSIGNHGININRCGNLSLVGNSFVGNANSIACGIAVSNSAYCTISGNTCNNNGRYGIAIYGTNAGTGGHTIGPNTLVGNGTAAFSSSNPPIPIIQTVTDTTLSDSASSVRTTLDNLYQNRTTRTKHAPAFGLYFPEAEGAVADGVADDSAAIAAAFTAAGTTGTVALARGKRYAIKSQVTIPTQARLNGNDATIVWLGATNVVAFRVNSYTKISHLTMDCGSAPPSTAVYVVSGADEVDLTRITVMSSTTAGTAFSLVGCTNTNIDYCDVSGAGIAYNVMNASQNCKLTHITAAKVTIGVQILAGTSAAPSDIDVDYFTVTEWSRDTNGNVNAVLGFPLRSIGGSTTALRNQRIRFRWCTILGPSRGYIDNATPGGTSDQINATNTDTFTAIGCISMYGGDMGMSITNCTKVNLIGNTTSNNTAGGITISTGCSIVTVSDNIAMNNGQNWDNHAPSDDARFGIGSRGANVVNLSNNVVGDNQATPTQNYGIRLLDAADNISVGPNVYNGNKIAKFYSDGAQTNLNNLDVGAGADNLGKQVSYAFVTTAATATIATVNTWTAFTNAPSITLPNDGGTYRVELHGVAATLNPAGTLAIGMSGNGGTTRIKSGSHNHTNTNNQDRAHLVAGKVVGSGQTITIWAYSSVVGTATILAQNDSPLELWATRVA